MDEETVIEGEATEVMPTVVDNSQVVFSLESTIKSHITSIDKIREELKKYKEMLDDIFENDETFQKHDLASKEAAKVKNGTKAQILKQPQAKELDAKIKTFKAEIKEQEQALSDYLQEYTRMAGVLEIEGDDGEVREIVYNARLIRKSATFK